jgi:ketosteroid isomerase-like protein
LVLRSKTLGLILALAAGGATYALWPRVEDSPEERIRRMVEEMAGAAEERDVGGILEHISEKFRGEEGMGKDEIRGYIAGHVLRGDWVRVMAMNLEVTLTSEDGADFSGKFVFARSEEDVPGQARRGSASAYLITGTLRREDGEWRFVSADHREVSAADLF